MSSLAIISHSRRSLSAPPWVRNKQLGRAYAQLLRQALQASQRDVALASLQAAHVGAVHSESVGERFLAQPQGQSVVSQIPPHDALEIADGHATERGRTLLVSLQTYK